MDYNPVVITPTAENVRLEGVQIVNNMVSGGDASHANWTFVVLNESNVENRTFAHDALHSVNVYGNPISTWAMGQGVREKSTRATATVTMNHTDLFEADFTEVLLFTQNKIPQVSYSLEVNDPQNTFARHQLVPSGRPNVVRVRSEVALLQATLRVSVDQSSDAHISMKHDDGGDRAALLALLRPQLTLARTIAFSPLARLRDPTTALFDPVTQTWHMWVSYKPLSATHIYATNATIRHFVLHSPTLNGSGTGVDGTWEDAGDALKASGVPGTFDADAVFTPVIDICIAFCSLFSFTLELLVTISADRRSNLEQNAAVECKAAVGGSSSCTWYLWHGGVSGNGPAKTNEERIGLAIAAVRP